MYESYDPFEEVLEGAKAVLSDTGIAKLPSLPKRGDFDLTEVLKADYAFA
jgi:DNA-directed RNA polymerase